jgi:hypothetical protein
VFSTTKSGNISRLEIVETHYTYDRDAGYDLVSLSPFINITGGKLAFPGTRATGALAAYYLGTITNEKLDEFHGKESALSLAAFQNLIPLTNEVAQILYVFDCRISSDFTNAVRDPKLPPVTCEKTDTEIVTNETLRRPMSRAEFDKKFPN